MRHKKVTRRSFEGGERPGQPVWWLSGFQGRRGALDTPQCPGKDVTGAWKGDLVVTGLMKGPPRWWREEDDGEELIRQFGPAQRNAHASF